MDLTFKYLARRIVPMLAMPPDSDFRIRGLVHTLDQRGLVAISNDLESGRGVILALETADPEAGLAIDLMVGAISEHGAGIVRRFSSDSSLPMDGHGNRCVSFSALSEPLRSSSKAADFRLRAFLGGIFGESTDPYADQFSFAGFMVSPLRRCRIYLDIGPLGRVGIEVPIDAVAFGSNFAYELDGLIRRGDLVHQKQLNVVDEYCTGAIFDMSKWVEPLRFPGPT